MEASGQINEKQQVLQFSSCIYSEISCQIDHVKTAFPAWLTLKPAKEKKLWDIFCFVAWTKVVLVENSFLIIVKVFLSVQILPNGHI